MRWLLLVWSACTYPPPQATVADAHRANVALAELTEGRSLLIAKCTDSACHGTPLPQGHRAAEWPRWVTDMAQRAQIDHTQKKLIEQYLVAMSGS